MNTFPGGRKQGFFNSVHKLFLADSPFLLNILKNGQKFVIHCRSLHPAIDKLFIF